MPRVGSAGYLVVGALTLRGSGAWRGFVPPDAPFAIVDLPRAARDRAVPVLKEGFVGIYRWHAKRKLFESETVRAATKSGELLGFSILERLLPEVGYVYYIAVGAQSRRRGLGGRLLDDALGRFRADGVDVVYAAAEEENHPSIALFRSRGFRTVDRHETGWREGGLGATGLRTRMMVVSGEVLMGLRFPRQPDAPTPGSSPSASAGS